MYLQHRLIQVELLIFAMFPSGSSTFITAAIGSSWNSRTLKN
jgi:hypothetical protein